MASSIIHMCIAKEINKYLKRNDKNILIGTIAPDISKQINETKEKSHFLNDFNDNIPNLDRFLFKYKKYLNDDFVMGYYIHLYSDYLWFKYFIPNFIKKDSIYTLDRKVLNLSEEDKIKYVYNDYTNLNIKLIDEYKLDLSIFYEDIPTFKNIIEEIPMDKLNLIIDKAGIIIKNSKINKSYIFDLDEINKFIEFCVSDFIVNIEKV